MRVVDGDDTDDLGMGVEDARSPLLVLVVAHGCYQLLSTLAKSNDVAWDGEVFEPPCRCVEAELALTCSTDGLDYLSFTGLLFLRGLPELLPVAIGIRIERWNDESSDFRRKGHGATRANCFGGAGGGPAVGTCRGDGVASIHDAGGFGLGICMQDVLENNDVLDHGTRAEESLKSEWSLNRFGLRILTRV